MNEKNNQSSKKHYRLVQHEGKITWAIEELWKGGVERGPFGNKEVAIRREENIARAEGFINDLVLMEVEDKEISHKDAFQKHSNGNWKCTAACSLEMQNKVILFAEGDTFTKGVPYLGIDVAKWLDEHN